MKLLNLDIEKVIPNPNQPRKEFVEEKIIELANSIEKNGLIQPIVVRKISSNKYEIIAGERRYRACKKIGQTKIQAIEIDTDNLQSYEFSVIENVQRENLNPIEEAESYKVLTDIYGYTQEKIAERVGKTRSSISNKLRLLKLPHEIKELVSKQKISYAHARTLLSFEDEDFAIKLSKDIIKYNYSVREIENLAKKYTKDKIKKNKKSINTENDDKMYVEKKLTEFFETKVNIIEGKKESGKIEINYYDYEDLERLISLIDIEFD